MDYLHLSKFNKTPDGYSDEAAREAALAEFPEEFPDF